MSSVAFSGDGNQGLQVANNSGNINFTHVSVASQPERAENTSPSSTVPFRRDPDFICRDIFPALVQKCSEPGSRTALVGLGGIGKSQLAIEYCYQIQERSPDTWAFWVHASNRARFEEGYRKIAERVRPPGWDDPKADILRLVCNWLSEKRSGKWTMVVDNADDLSIFVAPWGPELSSAAMNSAEPKSESLSKYLPLSSYGSILFTTRSREVALVLTEVEDDIMTVEPMDKSHANALFRKKLPGGHDEKQVAELLQALDFMPLAISQAAAYIRQRAPRVSIARYLSNFRRGEKDRAALLETDSRDPRRDQSASNSIIVTWHISFEHIREQRPSASRLLSLMSFFDRQGIPEFLLHNRSDEADEIDHGFEDDIATLRSYLLISLNLEGDMFSMHRLVQFSTRKWLELKGEEETWKETYVIKMNSAITDPSCADLARSRAWFPHAKIALSYRPISPECLAKWSEVLVKVSWYAESQGNYSVAETMAQEAFKWREVSLGKENLTTLNAGNGLALAYFRQGRYNEAEEMNRRVLEGRVEVLGEGHPETLTSMNNLALVFQAQGKYEAAEEMSRRALEGYGKRLGTDDLNYITCMSNLAVVLERLGKYEKAEEMDRRALKSYENAPGRKHPNYLNTMGNLALNLQKQGRYKEAEEINRRALEGYSKALGTEHPDYLMSVNNLAVLQQEQGKYEAAEQFNRQALMGRLKVLGKNHPDTLSSFHNLASVLSYQGKYNEAEERSRQAVEGYEETLGTDHPDYLMCMSNLANVLQNQGNHEASEKMNREILEKKMKVLGSNHPDTISSMSDLALTLKCQGKFNEAEEMFREALDGYGKALGTDHSWTLTTMTNLASVLRAQEKYEEGEVINRTALHRCLEVLGDEHPNTLISRYHMALLLGFQKKYEAAEEMYERALQGGRKVLGERHPLTLHCIHGLASLFRVQGKHEEADRIDPQVINDTG